MTNTTYTLTKEELQELINQAVITDKSSIQLNPELVVFILFKLLHYKSYNNYRNDYYQ